MTSREELVELEAKAIDDLTLDELMAIAFGDVVRPRPEDVTISRAHLVKAVMIATDWKVRAERGEDVMTKLLGSTDSIVKIMLWVAQGRGLRLAPRRRKPKVG